MSWPGPAQMNIHLRPYKPDPTRWRVDVKLMHPTTHTEIRKRLVAPAGLSEAQARAWGQQQVPKILGVALGMPSEPSPPPKQIKEAREVRRSLPAPKTISPPKAQMTLERFYYERFEPEHASMQKPATRDGYDTNFRNHLRPHLDKRHLDAYLRAAPGQGAACPPVDQLPSGLAGLEIILLQTHTDGHDPERSGRLWEHLLRCAGAHVSRRRYSPSIALREYLAEQP
jgi:hypothetical protein